MIATIARSRERQLGVLVAALSMVSIAAFVGDVYGLFDMGFVLSFGALPATIIIVGIVRWAYRQNYMVFYRRVWLGLAIGLAATAAYDLSRLIIQTVFPLGFNAFAIHPKFGALIIHQPSTTAAAIVVGWAYHISNGLTFALAYVLVAGRARWWFGLIWALVLQTAMVTMYPRAFGVERGSLTFLAVSFIGHAFYGTALGLLNVRFNEDEPRVATRRRVRAG